MKHVNIVWNLLAKDLNLNINQSPSPSNPHNFNYYLRSGFFYVPSNATEHVIALGADKSEKKPLIMRYNGNKNILNGHKMIMEWMAGRVVRKCILEGSLSPIHCKLTPYQGLYYYQDCNHVSALNSLTTSAWSQFHTSSCCHNSI